MHVICFEVVIYQKFKSEYISCCVSCTIYLMPEYTQYYRKMWHV